MLNKDLFKSHMGMLFEMYDRQPTRALLDGYYLVLQDMTDDEFKQAIKSILSSRTFASLPKPAEILEAVKPDTESIAVLIWQDIERAMIKGGVYASLTFEDNVVNSVVESLGGWIHLCKMDTDELKWVRKDIKKLYDIHSKRIDHPKHLVGLTEQANGYPPEISIVKASYQIPKREIIPALNPPERVADMIGQLTEIKKIQNFN
ncbi:MAG TPA: DUF6475 domain-containing protein [Methanosarcina sp.]|nr:DUF6475 domain-containing protein [Methanosarcina sp.]